MRSIWCLKKWAYTWGVAVLVGWTTVGCEPIPLEPIGTGPQIQWTFYPAAGSGGGVGPWLWKDQVIASSGDTLWQIHALTGKVTRRSALPEPWSNAFFPGETSLHQGDWAYALDAMGLLAVHLPSLTWSVLPWPGRSDGAFGRPEVGVEPALFAGPNDAVGLITKQMAPGQTTWTTIAWLWTPDKELLGRNPMNPWKAIWTLGWREPAVGFADGLAWHRHETSLPNLPAGWWRYRAPTGGMLVHTGGQRIPLVGNPTAHPPFPLTNESALVLFEDRVTAYHSKGQSLWSVLYAPTGHGDKHLWLGWVSRKPNEPRDALAEPISYGSATSKDPTKALWIKGSDDGLLAVDTEGNILRRWDNAGWSPSGKPEWDSYGGLWYCAEGALWYVRTDPSTLSGPAKVADENFQCTPAILNTDLGTLVVARNGLKISAYLCRQP